MSLSILVSLSPEIQQFGVVALLKSINQSLKIEIVLDGEDIVARIFENRPEIVVFDDGVANTWLSKFIREFSHFNYRFIWLTSGDSNDDICINSNVDIMPIKSSIEEYNAFFSELFAKVNNDDRSDNEGLTSRERDIIRDIALGLSSKEIADKNFISPHTVITHRKNITRKLGIKSISGLTIYAIVNKLISFEELQDID